MLDLVAAPSIRTSDDPARLKPIPPVVDVMALLTATLPPDWEATLEVDPTGAVSIIVMPACDDRVKPTFLLYEKDGQAQLATIRNERWESNRALATTVDAVAAIAAATGSQRR